MPKFIKSSVENALQLGNLPISAFSDLPSTLIAGSDVRVRSDEKGYELVASSQGGITSTIESIFTQENVTSSYNFNCFVVFNGCLYIGCSSGYVIKFDGSSWTTYTPTTTGVYMTFNCAVVYNGAIYFAGNYNPSYPGMVKFDGSTWTTYSASTVGNTAHIRSAIVYNNKIYFGCEDGSVATYDGSSWIKISASTTGFTSPDGFAFYDAVIVGGKLVFSVYLVGFIIFDGTTWSTKILGNKTNSYIPYLSKIGYYNNTAYFPMMDYSLATFDGTTWGNIPKNNIDASISNVLLSCSQSIDSGMFVADTCGCLYKFNGSSWRKITSSITGTSAGIVLICGFGGSMFVATNRNTMLSSGPRAIQLNIDTEISKLKIPYQGTRWSAHRPPIIYAWGGICYGNGLFVAIARTTDGQSTTANKLITSTDGIIWTARSISADYWRSVCYGNGKFVAVGNACVMASPDGVTWTSGTISSNHTSVCYGNGLFVAVGSNDISTSPDGVTWTIQTTTNYVYYQVCYGNGRFVAISTYGTNNAYTINILTSTDGITWTRPTVNYNTSCFNSICYGNGKFVAIGYAYGATITSTDGVNWVYTRMNDLNYSWDQICYGNGVFVAIDSYNGRCAYSSDGLTWSMLASVLPVKSSNSRLCIGNNTIVVTGGDTSLEYNIMTSDMYFPPS